MAFLLHAQGLRLANTIEAALDIAQEGANSLTNLQNNQITN